LSKRYVAFQSSSTQISILNAIYAGKYGEIGALMAAA
jgi:hypothetical protein